MYYSEGENSKGGFFKPINDDAFLEVNIDNKNNFEVVPNQNNENNNDNNERYIQTKMTLDNNLDSKQGKVRKKVTQACENCRKKRRKCTGERPKCLTCLQYNYVCYYNPFPKKRGPQQKREKRKYKKREKNDVNSNSSVLELNNKDEGLYNLKLIEKQFKRTTRLNDVNITQSIYNNVIAYKTSIHQKYKLNVNETPVIESELINYSVIDCYYKYFHPNYPILLYTTFTNYIKNDSLSKYLLFAMYGMAYLFQPKPNIYVATEYIEKAKSLIFQNYGLSDVQLLQALFLITVFESGTRQSWLFSDIATRIIEDNYFYYLNQTNNKDLYFDDKETLRAISLTYYGYDTWNNIMFRDKTEKRYRHNIQSFINKRSNILITITSELTSTNYEYFIISISLLSLELLHIGEKMNENDFSIEDIDSVNTDIIKIQKYFFKEIEDITLIKFNDIAEDFSYYQDLSEILEDEEYMKNNPLTGINSISINNKNNNDNVNLSKNSFLNNNCNSNNTNNCRDEFNKDPFIGIKDGRQIYSEILKRISQDKLLFSRKFKLLNTRISKIQTVFDMQKSIMVSLNSFSKCKSWMKFFMITGAQRIYLNRIYIQYVIKHPGKIKIYPIAKSIAVASKTADDCTIGLMLLIEAAENSNNLPIRFSFGKTWAFYQCCVIYILRYVATQERKYIKYYSRESIKYSSFSSYPQETLAPCYFYLDLLKQMRNYFPCVQNHIREIKILISEAENAVKNKTFNININEFVI